MSKHLTIGQKLALSFGAVLILTGLCTYFSVDTARRLGRLLDTEVNENAKTIDLITSIRLTLHEMAAFSKSTQFSYSINKILAVNSLKSHNARSMGECSACHAFGSATESQNSFDKLAQKADANADQLLPLVDSEKAREALASIRSSIRDWQAAFRRYLGLISSGDFAGGHGLEQNTMSPLMEKIDAAASQLEAEQAELRTSSRASARSSVTRSNWATALLLAISLVCGAFLVVMIRQINRLLRQLASDLNNGARRVSEEAEQLRKTGEALGQYASDQSRVVEQTATFGQGGHGLSQRETPC